MNFGPMEIAIIAIVVFALFGYKKLPDATRAIGRSLRIFKGEMKGMKDEPVETKAEAQTVRGELGKTTTPLSTQSPAQTPAPAETPTDQSGSAATPQPQPQPQATPTPPAAANDAVPPQRGTTPAN